MSRGHRKTPIFGHTTARSEANDKRVSDNGKSAWPRPQHITHGLGGLRVGWHDHALVIPIRAPLAWRLRRECHFDIDHRLTMATHIKRPILFSHLATSLKRKSSSKQRLLRSEHQLDSHFV